MLLLKRPFYLLVFCISGLNVFAQSPDSIQTNAGDIITGKIQSMNKAILVVETDYSDEDFKLEWEEVRKLRTGAKYRMQDRDGEIFTGKIYFNRHESDSLSIIKENTTLRKEVNSIMEITELDEKFIDKLRLGINLGYSYTKASGSQQISVRSNAGYVTDKWAFRASVNSFDTRIGEVVTSRSDANMNFQYTLANNWFVIGNLDLFNSEEQQIQLRTTGAAGMGNYLIRNYNMIFLLYTGAAFNNEVFTNTEGEDFQSYEAFIAGQYDLFGDGDLDVLTNFVLYPSITNSGRFRASYSMDLLWDLIYDFEAKLGFSLNYDSKPPNNSAKSDYVVSLTIGWSL